MNARYHRFLPFVLGALMMLTLTAVLMRYRYEVEMDRETSRAHGLLDQLGDALNAELNRGAEALNASMLLAGDPGRLRTLPKPHGWHGWRTAARGGIENEPGGTAAADRRARPSSATWRTATPQAVASSCSAPMPRNPATMRLRSPRPCRAPTAPAVGAANRSCSATCCPAC